MEYMGSEVIIRYFLAKGKDEFSDSYGDEVLLTQFTLDSTTNAPAIIPRKGERVYLTDILPEDIDDINVYDYYIIDKVDYSMSIGEYAKVSTMIDIITLGEDFPCEEVY